MGQIAALRRQHRRRGQLPGHAPRTTSASGRPRRTDATGKHLKLAYDQDGTWSLKYNGYPDRLLRLGLIPASVATAEAAWYLTPGQHLRNPAGHPAHLHQGRLGDVDGGLAQAVPRRSARAHQRRLGDRERTAQAGPDVGLDRHVVTTPAGGFQARPVVGGFFALLSVQ